MKFGICRTSCMRGDKPPVPGAVLVRPYNEDFCTNGLWVLEAELPEILQLVDEKRVVIHNRAAMDYHHDDEYPPDVKYIIEVYDCYRE